MFLGHRPRLEKTEFLPQILAFSGGYFTIFSFKNVVFCIFLQFHKVGWELFRNGMGISFGPKN